ncbi:MAG: nucleotidyl transferase AbiEii/AbiGii toxin family protein [Vicinamibacterales bacterium]
MTQPVDPIATALLVSRALDALEIPHTIGGSIASSFAGEPRATVDIDFVVAIEERHVEAFVAALSAEFYVDADAVRRAIRARSSANLIHQASQLKVDVFVAGGTPLDATQLARRQAVDLGGDRRLYVHPPEDILLQKLRWYRLGGEVSDRQWRDVEAIVRVQGGRLDLEYLRRSAPVLGVADLLERALAEPR